MSNLSSTIQKAVAIFLLIIGVLICLISIIPLLQFNFSPSYILILMLFAGGLLTTVGAYINLKKNKENAKVEEKFIETAKLENTNKTKDSTVLFHWEIDIDLWQAFSKIEKRNRLLEYIGTIIGISVLGTIILMLDRSANFIIALSVSGFIGFIFVVLKKLMSNQYLATKNNQSSLSVNFFEFGVVVNGNYLAFWNDIKYLENIKLKSENNIEFIEFVVSWKTRNGIASDEIRIPFTKEHAELVHSVKEYYLQKIEK